MKGTELLSTRISSLQCAQEQRLRRGKISPSLKLCLSSVFISPLWHPGQDLLHPIPWLCPHVAERTSEQLLCHSGVPKPKQSAVPSTPANLSQHAGQSQQPVKEGTWCILSVPRFPHSSLLLLADLSLKTGEPGVLNCVFQAVLPRRCIYF